MGNVKTEQIKRTAKELIKRYHDRFNNNFEDNKHLVRSLVQGGTPKVKNQITGYITHTLAAERKGFQLKLRLKGKKASSNSLSQFF